MRNWTLAFLLLTTVHLPMAWSQVSFAPTPTPPGTKRVVKPRPKANPAPQTVARPTSPRPAAPTRPATARPVQPAAGQKPVVAKPAAPVAGKPIATPAPATQTPATTAPAIVAKPAATPVPAPVAPAPVAAKPQPAAPPAKQKIEDLSLDLDTPAQPAPVAKPVVVTEKPYTQLAYGLMLWQENIKATRVTDTTDIIMQLQGVSVDYTFNYFFQTRPGWRHFYTFQLGFGTVRGQGTTPAIPDQLKGHTWNLGTVEPGVAYATSEVSEVGFALPLTYRKINWALQSESLLEMSRTTSFSAALALLYINHINKRWDLRVSINNELGWKATRWSAAGQFLY